LDDCRQPASDPCWLLLLHGLAARRHHQCKWNHWSSNATLVELLGDAISKSDLKGRSRPSRHFAGA
jgi:hypothetical protein